MKNMSVTKNRYLNILIGLLLILGILLLLRPSLTAGEDTASVLGYVSLPQEHTGINEMLEAAHPDYSLNGSCWTVIVLLILLALSLLLLCVMPGRTVALIPAMATALYGAVLSLNNVLMKSAGISIFFLCTMVVVFALSVFNGVWHAGNNAWSSDPNAKQKLRAIQKAEAKKNVDALALYTDSPDQTIRIAALDALGRTGKSEAFQVVVVQMQCPLPEVRMAAARALGNLGDKRGRSFLLHFIQTETNEQALSAMKDALSRIPVTIA